MATPLLLLLLLFTTATATSTSFILTTCRATRYPALCYHSLSPYAAKIRHSDRQLAFTALALSLARARAAARFVTQLRAGSHREFEAVKDCIETMGNSVDQLGRSIREMGQMGRVKSGEFMWHMNNVETWVSAALTDENTCVDGFSGRFLGGKINGEIKMRIVSVAQFTSNALALVNRFAQRQGVRGNNGKS